MSEKNNFTNTVVRYQRVRLTGMFNRNTESGSYLAGKDKNGIEYFLEKEKHNNNKNAPKFALYAKIPVEEITSCSDMDDEDFANEVAKSLEDVGSDRFHNEKEKYQEDDYVPVTENDEIPF